ncbi:MAG: DUF3137 domain-containing protein [Pseudomonadota bacterium]
MKTSEELKQYYEKNILPELQILDDHRIKIKKKLNPLIAIGVVVTVISLWLIGHFSLSIYFMIIPISICAVLLMGWYFSFYREFLSNYKKQVIQKIVVFVDPGLSYDKDKYVPKSFFLESQIFQARADSYGGDDFVFGKIGETDIQFSELNVKHIEKTGPPKTGSQSNRKRETRTYPVFKGLFFVADFNKNFTHKTIVLPDKAEKLFGRMGQKLQSMNITRGELIKLEDPEFEKMFVVYGDDQIESRYVLSTSLMKRIVDFQNKTNKEIYFSFVASKLFVAISYEKTLFEPSIFSSLIVFSKIEEYFEDLQIAINIVEDLNLNTRIWNKA